MHGEPPVKAVEVMREEWERDPTRDPITQVRQEFLERAAYHGRFGTSTEVAHAYAEGAKFLQVALEVIDSEELDYDEAAKISTLARDTIRNRESERRRAGQSEASRGRVQVSGLPLRGCAPRTSSPDTSHAGTTPSTNGNDGFCPADVAAGLR